MERKLSTFSVIFIVFMLISSLSVLVSSSVDTTAGSSGLPSLEKKDSFTPTVSKPAWVDQDNNGIADSLNQEINARITNGTTQNYVNVTVMLKSPPTTKDAQEFISFGGKLTTPLWTEALYGFGGTITYNGIAEFVQQCPDVLLVEKEVVGKANVAYAAKQVGARPYIWNTLGLQGDPNSSIAIVDTGIDSSHADFFPGYGDQNFSKKIVGWNDQVDFTASPFDDNGHGSHVAGLAAGNGFLSNASGYATATWGRDLTGASSGYTWSGMMVNNLGVITMSAKWMSNGTAKVNTLGLYRSGKSLTSWTFMNSVSTPANNTWYTLSFSVTPLGGYDMYNPRVDFTGGTGNLFVVVNMSWPYTPPSDNFSAWTGIAPQSKLVGAKVLDSKGVGDANQLISGINWIIANRVAYHITVASMSLGFSSEVTAVDSAVLNLVNSGISTTVAAGNDGSGSNRVYTPSSVDEVITVAAMNQFDNIASYSSQGGISRYTGKTLKPDITAPGGSFYAVPLFSVDSNFNDVEGGFADVQANDAAPMQGTSMAAPVISGCAQVVIQALGGYGQWNWSRSQALQPKMILLMTATETYPNLREGGTISTSPTLQRGGKDFQEGYGRVNLDAAVDALLKTYVVGNNVTDNLGSPPKLTDISVVGQRLAWARQVSLKSGNIYNFTLTVPAGADYDLYLYNSTGTNYGEPSIMAKSTNAGPGNEQLCVTAPYGGTYYVVVKRATESTASGNFTLSSSSQPTTVNVTLTTPGLANSLNVVHYMLNGVVKTGSIVENRFSDYADVGTNLTIGNPVYASSGQRYRSAEPTVFIVQPNFNVTYVQQNITIESSHPYNNNQDSLWTYTFSNASKVRVHFSNISTEPTYDYVYVLDSAGNTIVTSYTGNYTDLWSEWVLGDTINIRLTSDYSIVRDGFKIDSYQKEQKAPIPVNHTANFKTEYYLSVNSTYGSKIGEGWYENGTNATAALNTNTVDNLNGTRRIFTNWSGDASGTDFTACGPIYMNASKIVTANWKTQYYLNTTSPYGTTTGSGWYDSGTNVNAVLSTGTVAAGTGTQYVFIGWGSDASGTGLTSSNIAMSTAKTATAIWKTQYYLNVSSPYADSTGSGWYDNGTTAYATLNSNIVDHVNGTRRAFLNWSGDVTGSNFASSDPICMNASKTVVANWQTQYYLAVSSAYGTVGGEGWYNNDTTAYANVSSLTIPGDAGTQYVLTGWSENADGTTSTSNPITMTGPKIATVTWKTQYLISFTATPSNGGSTSPAATNMWLDLGQVSISATPSSGYLFSGWSSSTGAIALLNAASTSTTANINGPGTINANFAAAPAPTPSPTPTPSSTPAPTSPSTSTTPSPTTSPTATPQIPEITPVYLLLSLAITTGIVLLAKKRNGTK